MQISFSFVALSLLSFCAAIPAVTPVAPAVAPGPTDASWPTVPEHIVAEYLASLNSTSSLAKRDVHCETSGGSPYTNDVVNAINTFDGVLTCQQTNGGGSFCTTMGCWGTACVGICGPFLGSTNCQEARNGLFDTLNRCCFMLGGGAPRATRESFITDHLDANCVRKWNKDLRKLREATWKISGCRQGRLSAGRWTAARKTRRIYRPQLTPRDGTSPGIAALLGPGCWLLPQLPTGALSCLGCQNPFKRELKPKQVTSEDEAWTKIEGDSEGESDLNCTKVRQGGKVKKIREDGEVVEKSVKTAKWLQ
ncbi:hypothetical protein C8J57DRAFT_1213038 [Mycena rebaudengoi]|nr:hypothetical protein C8J57DRAFT_1213038 [Mycena rebaudengoi]